MSSQQQTTRPKRVAFMAHCLANQNAKVPEYARRPGVVSAIVEQLRDRGYEIQQLPCPEMTFLGVNRWWQAKEQYDTPGYRRHCRTLAEAMAGPMAEYYRLGYEVILVGLDGSPSSGVRFTSSKPTWGGRPESSPEDGGVVPGMGVWIEELKAELERQGVPFPQATGILLDSPTWDLDASATEFAEFLATVEQNGGEDNA